MTPHCSGWKSKISPTNQTLSAKPKGLGRTGLALARQRGSRTHSNHNGLSLGPILVYVHIYIVTYIICKMIAFVSHQKMQEVRDC